MSRLIGLGLLLAGLLYPFAVYYGTEHFAPWQFGLLLGSLWLLRALTGARRPGSRWMAAAIIVFCLLLAWFDNPQMLRAVIHRKRVQQPRQQQAKADQPAHAAGWTRR